MKTITETAREINVIREVDVVVAGGGPAGVAAAIAAARNGARTLLVERYGYLGGMITGSYVTYYMGFGNGVEQIIRGLAQETINRLREFGGITKEQDKSGDCYGDAEIIKCLYVIMLEEAGVETLLHTWIAGSVTDKNVCRGIIVENKSGRQAVLAKVVIDATADADISVSAGVGVQSDNSDISLLYSLTGIDNGKAGLFQKEHREIYQNFMNALDKAGGNVISRVKDKSAVNAWDLTAIENDTRKRLLKKVVFMRENVPGYENMSIKMTAPQIGVRESRKIKGEYVLTENDITANCRFSDSIGRCGAYMVKYENYEKAGLSYDIPYRVLLPESIDGLLAAGRCISATHGAINTLRLIVPCILSGEAAGTAAAIAARQNITPRNIDIKMLQLKMKEQGNNLG